MVSLLIAVVITAIIFDYINGFHDAANAIATVVSTGVLPIRTAVLIAAVLNFAGAMTGTAVAKTISSGFTDAAVVTQSVVLAALLGASAWNLITWWYGIPSSSSHALVGGLAGSVVAHAGLAAFKWEALVQKVLVPLVASPTIGFVMAFFIMIGLSWVVRGRWPKLLLYVAFAVIGVGVLTALLNGPALWDAFLKATWETRIVLGLGLALFFAVPSLYAARPNLVQKYSRRLQLLSASMMAYSHGSNDAQKSMGIITLALAAWVTTGHSLPDWMPSWVLPVKKDLVPTWVIIACASAIAAGTAAGGVRIIKTMGTKIIRISPLQGFAAETAGAMTILGASHLGIPVSTTHCINACIMGVGASKRVSAVRWGVASNIIVAWVVTLPAAGAFAFVAMKVLGLFFE
jgi:PiT family inorganic phosphate transporter